MPNARPTRRDAFTLLELTVVLAILAALAVMTAPSIAEHFDATQVRRVESELTAARRAVEQYAEERGALPDSLAAIREDAPLDPWDRPYRYERTPEAPGFRLFTLGRDGAPGGEGLDADRFAHEVR